MEQQTQLGSKTENENKEAIQFVKRVPWFDTTTMGATNSNLRRKVTNNSKEWWIFTQAAHQTDTKCISMSKV